MTESKRIGRPMIEGGQTNALSVRLTREFKAKVDAYALSKGITRHALMIKALKKELGEGT